MADFLNASAFPLMRSGGLFVLLVGLGIAGGGVLGRKYVIPLLIAGGVLAFVSQIFFGARLTASLGTPTSAQTFVLVGAIALEMVLVGVVGYVIRDPGSRRFWLWILVVVGLHLVILSYAQGLLMLVLGVLCTANAAIGLQQQHLPYLRVWALDGALKVAFGALMLLVVPN